MMCCKRAVVFGLSVLLLMWTCGSVRAGELPGAPAGAFSIVIIPDTQQYQEQSASRDSVTNATFETWTDWIAANITRQRIVFVSHVGDIVDKNQRDQWAVARRCMDKLHGKVPYGITVGNHDMVPRSGDSSLFQDVFPKSRFENFDWYGGCFTGHSGKPAISGNNANSCQLFSAAGMNFVALQLECNAPDDVLAWADAMLKKHADRRAIITTHMDLGPLDKPKKSRDYFDAPKGRMRWKKCHGRRGNTSQQMWDKCLGNHKNVFMICCGDQSRTQALHQSVTGKQGNVVHELLSDYRKAGVRVMRFLPSANKIEVRTWDPINGKLREKTSVVPDRGRHQFELTYAMDQQGRSK